MPELSLCNSPNPSQDEPTHRQLLMSRPGPHVSRTDRRKAEHKLKNNLSGHTTSFVLGRHHGSAVYGRTRLNQMTCSWRLYTASGSSPWRWKHLHSILFPTASIVILAVSNINDVGGPSSLCCCWIAGNGCFVGLGRASHRD